MDGLSWLVYHCFDNGELLLCLDVLKMTSPSLLQEWLPQMFRNQQHSMCARDGDYYCSEEVGRDWKSMGFYSELMVFNGIL